MFATDRKLRVFLCHASQDKPSVRELYQKLLAESWIDPWLDEENLLPGQDWDMEIEKAVEAADTVIVFLSSSSVTKEGYIQKELRKVLNIALEKLEETIFVIPFRLNDCELPRQLRSLHHLDYFPMNQREPAYQRLVNSLKMRTNELGLINKNGESDASPTVNAYEIASLERMIIGRWTLVIHSAFIPYKYEMSFYSDGTCSSQALSIMGWIDEFFTSYFQDLFQTRPVPTYKIIRSNKVFILMMNGINIKSYSHKFIFEFIDENTIRYESYSYEPPASFSEKARLMKRIVAP